MQKQRVFHSLLNRVGANGSYQNISLAFWCLTFLTVGASTFYNAFLFHSDSYTCSSSFEKESCHQYVCSLPMAQRSQYINEGFSSLATEFGDYRCDHSELDRIQLFIYFGGFIGLMCGSYLNGQFPKKKIVIFTLAMSIVGLALTISAPSLFLAGFGLFINFASRCIQSQVVICCISESSAEERRGRDVMIAYISYGMGVTLNGVIFHIFSSWKVALLVYQMIPFVFLLLAFIFYVEQTPFDLVIYKSAEEAYSGLLSIASKNGEKDHKLTLDEISVIKQEYEANRKEKHDYKVSIIDLFQYKSLKSVTILCILLNFCISIEFFIPELVLDNYAVNIYVNGAVLGSSEIFSSILCTLIINNYERKKALYATSLLGFVIACPVFIFASCGQEQECNNFTQIAQTIGIFLYRFFVTISFNYFFMIQIEVFPSQIRALAMQVTGVSINLAILVTPSLKSLFEAMNISIIALFFLANIFVIILTCGLPETFKVPPPQMIEELKYEHHDFPLKQVLLRSTE